MSLSSTYKGDSARFSRVVSGYPTLTSIPQVDGLSTDPRVLGRHRHSPMTQPTRATTRPACAQRRAAACMCTAWPWGESRYNSLYRGWGQPLVSRYGAARLRYSAATRQQRAVRRRYSRATWRSAGVGSI